MTSTLAPRDLLKWTVNATVAKWSPDQVAALGAELGHEPTADELDEVFVPQLVEQPGNLLTTAGLTLVMNRLTGSGQAVDNTHTRLGVGNSSTAENVADTDLKAAAGSTNRWFMTMDATYPSVAAGVLTARSTFAAGDANFAWNEWGIWNSTSTTDANANMLNRKVEDPSLGTKTSAQSWQIAADITITT